MSLWGSLVAVLALAQGFRTSVPYEEENGKLLTTIVVNGVAGRFLIDTGAPCCLSADFAEKVGAKLGKAQGATDSNGRLLQTQMLRIDSLRIGRGTLRRVSALRLEKGGITDVFGVDGILGYNVFRMGIIKFETQSRHFIFTSTSEELGLKEEFATPLIDDPYLALIALPFRAKDSNETNTDTVMFDAGAVDFYEMSMRSYQRLRSTAVVETMGSAEGVLSVGAAGMELPSWKYRIKIGVVPLSGLQFTNVTSITTDAAESRLGTMLLRYGDVAIDYVRRKFYFLPHGKNTSATNDNAPIVDLYMPEWDVVITISPQGYLNAGVVWDNNLPIRAGDRIVEVNGKRYDEALDLRMATTTPLLSMPGHQAKISYIDKVTHQERSIVIHKK